jgi:alcohol dehydrogenase
MSNFSFVVHTPVYVGPNCIKANAEQLKKYGKRAFLITSDFGKFRHYALEDMEENLKGQGIEYKVNKKVIENPPVESVKEITEDARNFNPDFLIAVGGGSSLDTAKAVSVLLPHPDKDPYQVFWGDDARHTSLYSEGALPLIVAPTTAGTGSEVTAGAVLTRADIDTKITIYQNVFCDLAFLDPRYIQDSPPELLHTGLMDALCHAVESYVNVKSNDMTRAMGEIGMKMFAKFKDNVLTGKLTESDYQNMLIASYYDGMAFQCGTALPHGMGYPLSHHKGVYHGLACGIFQAEYLRAFKDQSLVEPVIEMCGFDNIDKFAEYIQRFIAMDVHMEVTEREVREWAELFCKQEAHRLKRHPEPIGLVEVTDIYLKSLANYIR